MGVRPGHRPRAEAQHALTEALGRFQAGAYVEPSKQTLAQFLAEWLQAIRPSLRPSTFAAYETLCRAHVIPALGETPVQQLTTERLNGLYPDLMEHGRRDGKGGLSPRTVRYIHATIRKALAEAVRWGRLIRNVADQCSPPRPQTTKRPATWTAEELRGFLEHVSADRLYGLYHLAGTPSRSDTRSR